MSHVVLAGRLAEDVELCELKRGDVRALSVPRDEGFKRGSTTSSSCASSSRRIRHRISRTLTSRSFGGIGDGEGRRRAWGADVDGDVIVRH